MNYLYHVERYSRMSNSWYPVGRGANGSFDSVEEAVDYIKQHRQKPDLIGRIETFRVVHYERIDDVTAKIVVDQVIKGNY